MKVIYAKFMRISFNVNINSCGSTQELNNHFCQKYMLLCGLQKIKFLALFRKSQTFTIIYTRNIHTVPLYASFKHSTHSQLKNVIAQRNHDGACTAFHKGSLPTI